MAASKDPNMKYNGSGYVDKTARDAICKADSELLNQRRTQLVNKLRMVAQEHGFRICGKVTLIELNYEEKENE